MYLVEAFKQDLTIEHKQLQTLCNHVKMAQYIKKKQRYFNLRQRISGPAKWRFTVGGEVRFMTSHLES